MRLYPLWLVFDAVFGKLHKVTNYPVVRHLFSIHLTQAARPRGTCNYPLSLFACRVNRQAHALRSFGQPIYIEVSGLRVIQVPHGLSCLLDQEHLARLAERVRHEAPRFPVRESAYADPLMRRCFARVLLKMNLVGEESPRCLTLFAGADRGQTTLDTLP